MKKIIYLLLLFPLTTLGQRTDDIVTLRIGYGSTDIVFKEAFAPSINIFGSAFNTGKTFVGEGPQFGISKNLGNHMFAEVSFSTFSGRETKAKVNTSENYYTLKGFQLPLTVNYLLRDSSKSLRINVGGGVQFLKGHLQQYETIGNSNGQTTNQITNINISEFQLTLIPGVQFRIVPNLFASFIVRVGISTNGRYTDNPCLSLKYTFRAKK